MPLEIVFSNTMEMPLPAIVITILGLPLVRVLEASGRAHPGVGGVGSAGWYALTAAS